MRAHKQTFLISFTIISHEMFLRFVYPAMNASIYQPRTQWHCSCRKWFFKISQNWKKEKLLLMLSVNKWKHTHMYDYIKAAYTICSRGKFDVTFKGSLNMIIFLFTTKYNKDLKLLMRERRKMFFKKKFHPLPTLYLV